MTKIRAIKILWVLFALNSMTVLAFNTQCDEEKAEKDIILVVTEDIQDTNYVDKELSNLFSEKKRLFQNYKHIRRLTWRTRAFKICALGMSSSMLIASLASRNSHPDCWEFLCNESANLSHLSDQYSDCLDRFVSKSCALLGAHCQDVLGNFFNATLNWNESCQHHAQALSKALFKTFAVFLAVSGFSVFVNCDDICHKSDYFLTEKDALRDFHEVNRRIVLRKTALEQGPFDSTGLSIDLIAVIFSYTGLQWQYQGDSMYLDSLIPPLPEA